VNDETNMGDPGTRARLGEAGREYAHGWSASKQAERLLDFYRTVNESRHLQ